MATEDFTLETVRKMRGLFAAIEMLGHEIGDKADAEIVALAEIGTGFADQILNSEVTA